MTGIWENTERFIEYAENAEALAENGGTQTGSFNMVLKTYYRFVYEDMGIYPVTVEQQENLQHVYTCAIRYPHFKQPAKTTVWVYNDSLFTSFYRKIPYTVAANSGTATVKRSQDNTGAVNTETVQIDSADASSVHVHSDTVNLLDGFWIEQGFRNGILIYPQEIPEFFDAFFFNGSRYIKFRYWKGDFEYKEQRARFTDQDGQHIAIPKMFKYADAVYRCITDNGSTLKNYEQGSVSISKEDTAYRFTLTATAGGPGSHAVGDTYPHHQYPQIKDLPLYFEADGSVFAFGTPFLTRSSVKNLQEEVKKHNSLKRKPPEPLLKADELDFYRDRIKEIRKEK